MPLQFGDTVQVHVQRRSLEALAHDPDLLMPDAAAVRAPRLEKGCIAVAIMLAVLLSAILGLVPFAIAGHGFHQFPGLHHSAVHCLIARMHLPFFSFISVSVDAPTLITVTPPISFAKRSCHAYSIFHDLSLSNPLFKSLPSRGRPPTPRHKSQEWGHI
jgi:hypothetical protein